MQPDQPSAPPVALHHAGTYRREVQASLPRIHENVWDWEHLPALHGTSFAACELLGQDAEGWRVRLTSQPGNPDHAQVLKLAMRADGLGYTVTTEAGPGTPSEIRVVLTPRAEHETGVLVEYHVPEADPQRLAMIGAGFVSIYEQLWDEDEAMMRAREAALAPRPRAERPARLDLGSEAEVRGRLPLLFEFGPARFRLVELDGALIAHAATCPHWLAPLDDVPVVAGCITCPWHRYRFDVATGRSADGRGLRLAPAPAIHLEAGRVIACA